MYEFFQAALPWILMGLLAAVSCAFSGQRGKALGGGLQNAGKPRGGILRRLQNAGKP